MLFHLSKSAQSSTERTAIYIVDYLLPLSLPLPPTHSLSLSLSDLLPLPSSSIPHLLPLLHSAFKSSRLCSLLLRNANADYSTPEWEQSNLEAAHPVWGRMTPGGLNTTAVGTTPTTPHAGEASATHSVISSVTVCSTWSRELTSMK